MSIEDKILGNLTKNSLRIAVNSIPLKSAEYFYLSPENKSEYVKNRLVKLQESFLEFCEQTHFEPINHSSSKSFYTYGMISSPNGEKITNDVYLFNSIDDSNVPVKLDLSLLSSYSLFNGQIVALKGINSQGNSFLVEKIFYHNNIRHNNKAGNKNISLQIAKGPFSSDYIKKIFENSTGLYILLGPFIDSGDSFENMKNFTDFVSKEATKYQNAKVFLVPSLDDQLGVKVFPQPVLQLDESYKNIHSCANPCYFSANDHIISVSNFDCLIDLAFDEVNRIDSKTSIEFFNTDRNTRLMSHMIFQQSFLPVLNSLSAVSYGDWLDMPFAPDLYFFSSKINVNSKKIGPSTMVNVGNNSYIVESCKNGEFDVKKSSFNKN